MNGGPIVYKPKYQNTVTLSSAEAEYLAISVCAQDIVWVLSMLRDLGFKSKSATQVWEENQGSIALAQNSRYHARTKHVDIRNLYSREGRKPRNQTRLRGDRASIADVSIKALGTKRFDYLRSCFNIIPGHGTKDRQ